MTEKLLILLEMKISEDKFISSEADAQKITAVELTFTTRALVQVVFASHR